MEEASPDYERVDWERLSRKLLTSANIKRTLKGKYGIVTTAEVKRRVRGLIEALKKGKYPHNLWVLENKVIPNVDKKEPSTAELLRLIIEEIRKDESNFGFEDSPIQLTEEESTDIERKADNIAGVIGRVAITRSSPATPYRFSFWLERNPDVFVEPGEFIVVKLPGNHKALGIVDEIRSVSDIGDIQTHHYTWAFGSPEEEMPTEIPIVREGVANLIYRDDSLNAPFTSSFVIMKSQSEILEKVFSELIREENRVLLGFVKDGNGFFVPVFGDFSYLFGYEGGHVNITGKSGVAGKTSYALFSIASALSFSRKSGKTLGVIGFNVKERDLLDIEKVRDYDSIDAAIEYMRDAGERDNRPELRDGADMWEKAKEYGVDPVEVFGDATIFVPPSLTGLGGNSEGGKATYNYGLQDLLERGIHIFSSLFDPQDINDPMESLIYSIQDEFTDGITSFNRLMTELKNRLTRANQTRGSQGGVEIGRIKHFSSTVQKMMTRLNKILSSSRVIEKNNPYGTPINVFELTSDDFWIVDIAHLPENEQRMVFYSILSDLKYVLERKKEGMARIPVRDDFKDIPDFPSRVCVFVDELNKFAPSSSRVSSSVKSFIVDIASRGRSIGLSLLGAEQFASQIDEEVLGNSSTYLIGKSEEFELGNRFYKRIPEGLRQRVPYLKKGELVLVHEMHATPFIINFPIPLHRVIVR